MKNRHPKNVCESCNNRHDGDCPVHDTLPVLNTAGGYDQASLAHTSLPVPSQLTVRPSAIPGAGLGVFATTFISKDTRMGLYEGRKVTGKEMRDHDTAYAWEITEEGQEPCLIDGKDPTHSNWLRFVNCARHSEEQNVTAYQYQGSIFYRTIKHIHLDNELLVWYGDQYARQLGLDMHSEDPDYKYFCQCCGDGFVEKKSLDIHIRRSAMCLAAFKCNQCQQRFDEQNAFTQHIRRHENLRKHPGDIPFECKYCGKYFKEKGGLNVHVKIHLGKSYECEHCGESFCQYSHLRVHLKRTHSRNKPYKCEFCKKCFTWKDSLRRHIKTHSIDESNRHQYVRTHSVDKPYKCEHCNMCFSLCGSLKYHIKLHSGDRPHKCDHCGKGFIRHDYLLEHLRKHSGDKPYKCDHCHKSFSRCGSLKRHIKLHSGDRPHKCDLCGKGFKRLDHLLRHLRKHSGDKPYELK